MGRVGVTISIAVLIAALMVVFVQNATSKTVVTVQSLIGQKKHGSLQLVGRVTEKEIDYETSPEFLLNFEVRDPGTTEGPAIPVTYKGIMPDTLKAGRDVILEGELENGTFVANSLLTQCPSKYSPEELKEDWSSER